MNSETRILFYFFVFRFFFQKLTIFIHSMEEQRKIMEKQAKIDIEKRYQNDADAMLAQLDKSKKVKERRTSMIMEQNISMDYPKI